MRKYRTYFYLLLISVELLGTPFSVAGLTDYSLDNKLDLSPDDLRELSLILKKPTRTLQEESLLENLRTNYSDNAYSEPHFELGYFELGMSSTNMKPDVTSEPVLDSIDKYWSSNEWDRTHKPVKIAEVTDPELFSKVGVPRSMHLPVKFPHSEFRVPREYIQFKDDLQSIVNFESSINPNISEYYAYLTLDQRFVPYRRSHRQQGAHVDGIPRNRKNPNTQKIDHSYLISDTIPTKFYVHPFFGMNQYSLELHNFFLIFQNLLNEVKTLLTVPYDINLMSAYSVHTAVEAATDTIRTFLRLEFSVLDFNRKGNSKNPYFDYQWEWKDCFTPKELTIPHEFSILKKD